MARTVTYTLRADTDHFESGIKRSKTAAQDFFKAFENDAKRLINGRKLADAFKEVGQGMTAAFTAPIVGAFGVVTAAAASFDREMVKSMSIMGNVSTETRKKLEENARSVAKTMGVSHEEAAKSYYFLASAGLTAEQSMRALHPAAQFAKAGFMDMNTATEILMDSQSALGLKFADSEKNAQAMTRVSDVITKASIISNASIEQLGQSITTKAGAAMRTFKIDVEQGAAALSVYADQGVKGRIAGERLDILIRELTTQARENAGAFREAGIAVFDQSGGLRNLADVIGDVETRFAGMSTEQKIAQLSTLGFRAEANSAILALVGMSGKLRENEAALRSAGGATQEVADKNLKSFSEQANLLKIEVLDVAIALGQTLLPVAQQVVSFAKSSLVPTMASAVEWFKALPTPVQNGAFAMVALVAAAGPAVWMIGSAGKAVGALWGALKTLAAMNITAVIVQPFVNLAAIGAQAWLYGTAGAATALAAALGPLAAAIAVVGAAMVAWKIQSLSNEVVDTYKALEKAEAQTLKNMQFKKRMDSIQPFNDSMKSGLSAAGAAMDALLNRMRVDEVRATQAAGVAETAAKEAAKALQEFKASWSYENLPGPGEFMGPENPFRSDKRSFNFWGDPSKFLGPKTTPGIHIETRWDAPIEAAKKSTLDWRGALQGIALVAGTIGGKFSETVNVIGNIGQAFKNAKTGADQFYAIAAGVGQIGGIVGGKTGSALQGAAGGAMSGFAIGGPVGAVIGGAIGGIAGLFGNSKKTKQEVAELKTQLAGLSDTAKTLGIDLTAAFASKSPAVLKAAIEQVNRAVEEQKRRLEGLSGFAGGLNEWSKSGVTDQASADRAGRYAQFAFGSHVKETGDIFGALDSVAPTLERIAAASKEFGLEIPKGVASLLQLHGLDESIKSQVTGLNSMAKGIAAGGLATQSLFTDLGTEAVSTRAKLEETGLSGSQSLALMQPSLQQLYELQKRHGFAVDETTQALLDEAKAQGIVGDQFMSANERIVELLGVLIEAVGGQLPEAYRRAGAAAEEYGRRASSSVPAAPGGPDGAYWDPTRGGSTSGIPDGGDGFAGGAAFRNFGAGEWHRLHGEEAVIRRDQMDRILRTAMSGPVSTSGGSGSATPNAQPIILHAKLVLPDGRLFTTLVTESVRAEGLEAHELRSALNQTK